MTQNTQNKSCKYDLRYDVIYMNIRYNQLVSRSVLRLHRRNWQLTLLVLLYHKEGLPEFCWRPLVNRSNGEKGFARVADFTYLRCCPAR